MKDLFTQLQADIKNLETLRRNEIAAHNKIVDGINKNIESVVKEMAKSLEANGWIKVECFAEYVGNHPEYGYGDIERVYWVHPRHTATATMMEKHTTYLTARDPSFITVIESLPEEDVFLEEY